MLVIASFNTQVRICHYILSLLFSLALAATAVGQTDTYHLHGEPSSTTPLLQLRTNSPDTASLAVQSANLKNAAVGEYVVKAFDTVSGVPNASGVIQAGSTITFTLWMNKTAASGVMFPRAKLHLNTNNGTLVCTATGTSALTTTLTKYTLTATVNPTVSISSSDRFYVWVGVNVTTKATANTNASLSIEGVQDGNYDSNVIIPTPIPPPPPPVISNIAPSSGSIGTAVTINGLNFNATQGTSTVTFNGVAAAPTNWGATSIVVPVPSGATTGLVFVTVGGQVSNSISFTVVPKITALDPPTGSIGTSTVISGTSFGATQGTSTVTFNGVNATPNSWNDNTIMTSVPVGATTGPVVVTRGSQGSNPVTFTVVSPGQTPTTYHLHKEASGSSTFQLTTAAPDSAITPIQSIELRSLPAGEYLVKAFETQSGVPNASGVIPVGTIVSFTVWMKKTANFGEMYPLVKLFLNNESGSLICATTDSNLALTTFVSKRTLACTLGSEITVASSDRLYLWVGVDVDVTATDRTKAELDVEGTLNGNYDSFVLFPALVPRPSISSLSPTSGATGTSVTITGNNFGDAKDNSVITFNEKSAIPTSWTDTQIVAPVPNGATSGLVTVTRKGIQSNTLSFEVVSGTISGTISDASTSLPVAGVVVEALQAGAVRRATRTRSAGTYSLTELNAGVYELRVSTSDYATAMRSGISVSAGSTTTTDVTISKAGAISGVVTRSDGTTPIAGAALKVFQGSSVLASAVSSATGTYNIEQLNPGSYTVQASAPAYQNQNQTGVVVTAQATTTVNFNLNAASASGLIRYVYDEAGRLVSVTDGTGESAKYAHDSVGNIVSISRHSPGQVSIFEVTPNSGVVGTSVTIVGSGFSTTPTDNVVRFNGTQATINFASAEQLVVSVPTGAVTGALTVTTPNGATSSPSPFVIDTNRPTIIDFNPKIGNPGSSVTITGTNFEPALNGNQVTFNAARANVIDATAGVISTLVPAAGSTSGRITIDTPNGTAVSAGDFFVTPKIPDFCCYSATDIEFTSRMSIGESKVITINTANKLAMVVFDAQAGQRISFNWTNVSINSSAVRLYYPGGTQFGDYNFPSMWVVGNGSVFTTNFLSNLGQPYSNTVPFTGTYTILVDPDGSSTGSLTLTLGLVPPDNVYNISVGGPSKNISLNVPGQNAQVFFTGLAGERVGMFISNSNIAWRDLSVFDPNGKLLTDLFRLTVEFNDFGPLPMNGTYMIVVNALDRFTGSFTLTLYDIPPDFTAPIIAGGATVTATTTVPGQNALLTFNGTVGQRVSLKLGSGTLPNYFVSIRNPDNSILLSPGASFASSGGFINPQTLPSDGVYTIVVDGFRQHIGSVPLTLYLVPADNTGSTVINGTATTISTTTPGQNALITVSAQVNQAVTVRITNNNMGNVTVRLLKPDGTSLTSTTSSNTSFNLSSTLPIAGTYTISIDPTGSNFGSISMNVTSP